MSFGTLIAATARYIGTDLSYGCLSVSMTTRMSRSLYPSAVPLATEPKNLTDLGKTAVLEHHVLQEVLVVVVKIREIVVHNVRVLQYPVQIFPQIPQDLRLFRTIHQHLVGTHQGVESLGEEALVSEIDGAI